MDRLSATLDRLGGVCQQRFSIRRYFSAGLAIVVVRACRAQTSATFDVYRRSEPDEFLD